jgi:hypothetical protein
MQEDTFYKCVEDSQGNNAECAACIIIYSGSLYPYEDSDLCAAYEPYLCGEVGACPSCGSCAAEDVAWTNCLLNGTCNPFACPGPASGNASAPGPIADRYVQLVVLMTSKMASCARPRSSDCSGGAPSGAPAGRQPGGALGVAVFSSKITSLSRETQS